MGRGVAASKRARERIRFRKGVGVGGNAGVKKKKKLLEGFVCGTIISCQPAFARPRAL